MGRGAGADFGSDERGCGGFLTVLDSDETTNPIAAASAPFADGPYRPEGNLASLYGEDARGRWTLRITNGGRPARLNCFTLDVSRDVPQTLSARMGTVAATVTYTERNFLYEKLRVRIARAGRTALDAPIQRLGCPDCANDRPSAVKIRDLDGGEPEVLVDLFSGGAHCCLFTLILRWDAAAKRYRSTLGVLGQLRLAAGRSRRRRQAGVLGLRRALRLRVHRLRLLVRADPDLELPGGQARGRHAQVPGTHPEERGDQSRVLPEGPRRTRTRTSGRTSPPTSPTSTCSGIRPKGSVCSISP